MTAQNEPVVISLADETEMPHPADAPQVIDKEDENIQGGDRPKARATRGYAKRLGGLFFALCSFYAVIGFWNFAQNLLEQNLLLGISFSLILLIFGITITGFIAAELIALYRLRKIENFKISITEIRREDNLAKARAITKQLRDLYKSRDEMRWTISRFDEQTKDQLDAEGQLALAETILMTSLDKMAQKEIERSVRQVSTITALVPLALVDVAAALICNLRMIRRIAQVYGGRSGLLSSWRLFGKVTGHLIATGAMAIGDDWLGSVLGGSLFSKLSRRFGEGIINGALTARVGRAAMDICRPMPFHNTLKPRVSELLRDALTGLFDRTMN
ncbi:MAG: TIGR01620 family protein [Rhodobacteraceae bacterium]|nr:MAG: TIGR01620 family protein [Paracoccaceae bacterium]